MGITGELVRSVFSKSRSAGTHEVNVKNSSAVERRRWSSVRSYLCGDEFNSVLAEEDSASRKSSEATISIVESSKATITEPVLESSEATVTQPIPDDLTANGDIQSKEPKEESDVLKHNTTAQLFQREDAAAVIQTAFRRYLAKRHRERIEPVDGNQELVVGTGSPSRESVGTSIEVQTGNSTDVFSKTEEIPTARHRPQQKARTPVSKIKEDWDDSPLSSNMTKMRIQNRLEATTRRERALAYAFSQQLRICSKKKQNRSEDAETNMGWSWLERWMATRLPETSSLENHENKQFDPININRRSVVRRRLFDVAMEEKESCGSNEVSLHLDAISVCGQREELADTGRPAKDKPKAPKNISRRKTVPSHNCPREHTKASKKEGPLEDERDKRQKQKHSASRRDIKCKDATSQLSPDFLSCNSKLDNK
ncbi:hypothetical protein NMG60_11035345 [Bertholletia excelsa]